MTITSAPPAAARERRPVGGWAALRPLLRRIHFYAGVLVAPFLVVAALTGLLFTLTPQLDSWTYGRELHVDRVGDRQLPADDIVAAARRAHPEGTVAAVELPAGGDATAQVVLDVEGLCTDCQRTVYVDPYTGEVRGALTTWFGSTPLTTWLDQFHQSLHLGSVGVLYSETAASWLWVLVLAGLALWLGRRRRRRRSAVLPDLSARYGVKRTMGWHGATGLWLAVGLLVLSATGLTWSDHAGARFSALLDTLDATRPELDTALGTTTPATGGGEHAGHGSTGAGSGAATGYDRVLGVARAAGVDGPVSVAPPAGPGTAWSVTQTDDRWPVRQDAVAVDPVAGTVTATATWADRPLLSKLSTLGVLAHMGILFGPVNQILLAALAVGLLCVIVWGYRMWWQRRPARSAVPVGEPPARGAWRRVSPAVLVPAALAVVAVGWALPALGVTLLGFLVLDVVLGRVRVLRGR